MHLSNYYFAPKWMKYTSYAWLKIHDSVARMWQRRREAAPTPAEKEHESCKSWQVEGGHSGAFTPTLGHLLPEEKRYLKEGTRE